MTKHECRKIIRSATAWRSLKLVIRASCFFRHWSFVIGHSLLVALIVHVHATAAPLLLPTANNTIYEPGQEEKFFVPTPGKPWTSGTFGCVRTEGWQVHEGLDIRS